MRVKHKVNVVASVDTAGKDKLFALDDVAAEVTLDGFSEVSSGSVDLLAAGSFTIPLAGLSNCRGIFLKATGDFSVTLNGGSALNIQRGYTGSATRAESARMLAEAIITSASVVAGASKITLQWLLWGDPVA